jgi:hypothetical protein
MCYVLNMLDQDQRPLCPKCGCPARHVRGRALVQITLNLDNSLGKVNRVSDTMELPEREYACGMDHRWTVRTSTPSTSEEA